MNKKRNFFFTKEFEKESLLFLSIFIFVALLTFAEIIYLSNKDVSNIIEKKKQAVALIKLPDLAIVTEATWLRHRSLSNVFTVFSEDGSLLDYYPASFVYKIYFPQNKKNSLRN
jgi:hypothetical protein